MIALARHIPHEDGFFAKDLDASGKLDGQAGKRTLRRPDRLGHEDLTRFDQLLGLPQRGPYLLAGIVAGDPGGHSGDAGGLAAQPSGQCGAAVSDGTVNLYLDLVATKARELGRPPDDPQVMWQAAQQHWLREERGVKQDRHSSATCACRPAYRRIRRGRVPCNDRSWTCHRPDDCGSTLSIRASRSGSIPRGQCQMDGAG